MFNENWDLHVCACWEQWNSWTFYDLKRLPTYHAYLGMLALATSAKHLEKLHNLLPANQRLPRAVWINFRKFWQRYFTGKNADKLRNQLNQWLLWELSISFPDLKRQGYDLNARNIEDVQALAYHASCNATLLYVRQIHEHGAKNPLTHFAGGEDGHGEFTPVIDVANTAESVRGSRDFLAHVFGANFVCELAVSEDKKFIRIRIIIKQCDLTAEIAHKIVHEFPPYYVYRFGVTYGSSHEGNHFYASYEIETGCMVIPKQLPSYGNPILATPEFLKAISDALRQHGIPLEKDLAPAVTMAESAEG